MGGSLGSFVSPQVLELIQEQMRRLANNVATSWMRLAWKSTRILRRAAAGAVVIGVALALGTRRARD
jgi:hypothetical protein